MKKLLLLLICVITISNANATHMLGGEVYWRCAKGPGLFTFYMELYRNCANPSGTPAAPWNFTINRELDVFGANKPRNANNQTINLITMIPQTTLWNQQNQGELSPDCSAFGTKLSCSNPDQGTVQRYFYKSQPIQLKGTPPAGGWTFYFESACCRPQLDNINNQDEGAPIVLRAKMYPDKNNTPTDMCNDGSPRFLEVAANLVCRGYTFTFNHNSIDDDLDSLSYQWAHPINPPLANPINVRFENGTSFNSPTPNSSVNNRNIALNLDQLTGQMQVALFSGVGVAKYATVVQVDAWREGVRIASVFREIPFVFFDCAPLSTGVNNPPTININNVANPSGQLIELVAGQRAEVPFNTTDLDINNGLVQNVTLVPNGFMFATDFRDSMACLSAQLAPCATLRNVSVSRNALRVPPRYEVTDIASISTEFIWQTDCKHVQLKSTGVPGTSSGIYNFVMRVQDDHCTIPGINYPTITIKITDPLPIKAPIMKGASVGLDGKLTYSWVPPLDSATSFNKYIVEQSNVPDGSGAIFQQLGVVAGYKQDRKINYPIYVSNNDILFKIPNKDWSFRMDTESGCTGDVPSVVGVSDPVRVMEVEATPGGTTPFRSEVTLNWNRPKPVNSLSDPDWVYESKTHFYIWESVNVDNPTEAKVASNWYLRGDTVDATEYKLSSNACNGMVGFRIEARDTVIMHKQGFRLKKNKFDTLYYSTFSTVDTTLMKTSAIYPTPHFDTIDVRANGDIFFKIDRANAGTADAFNIYDSTIAGSKVLVGTVPSPGNTFLLTGTNAQTTNRTYILESIDLCNALNKASSKPYKTILLSDSLREPECLAQNELYWDAVEGFPNLIQKHDIYLSYTSTSGPFTLIGSTDGVTTNFVHSGVNSDSTYYYKIVATDVSGSVNISAVIVTSHNQFRSYEIVPAPELRCIYVEDNDDITLSWIEPTRDSTNNFIEYVFDYRINGGNWITETNPAFSNKQYLSHTFTLPASVDPNTDIIEFRSRTLSGCSGNETSPASKIIQVMDVNVTADINKIGTITWTETGVAADTALHPYKLYKSFTNASVGTTDLLANRKLTNFTDVDNGALCDLPAYYRVEIFDPIGGCVSRSNVGDAIFIDQKPKKQLVDYISVTYDNRVVIKWANPVDFDLINQNVIDLAIPNQPFTVLAVVPTAGNVSRTYTSLPNEFNVTTGIVELALQPEDKCSKVANEFNYHKTMNIKVDWNECDSVFDIEWNPYETFNMGTGVEYIVYWDTAIVNLGNPYETVAITDDTTAQFYLDNSFTFGDTPTEFRFYVQAKPTGTSRTDVFSRSNRDTLFASYGSTPEYDYLSYATVSDQNEVELEVLPDANATLRPNIGEYIIYRGLNKEEMSPIGSVPIDQVINPTFTYLDGTVNTDEFSYFYKVVVQNQCGGPIDTSNYGSTILLDVVADNEALTNTLTWNNYVEWDSTVAFYNVYRRLNDGFFIFHEVVAPKENSLKTVFVDDVYDNSYAKGDFCYYVEAVQGPVTTDFGIDQKLNPAISTSNQVCVIQEPLFYIPNAFAPDGLNKVFGPQGQFVNWAFYEMVIYNRWGEQVYITKDPTEGWDGKVNGVLASLGSYVYTIRFHDATGKEHKRKGSVTVIR